MTKKTIFSRPVKRQTMAEQMAQTVKELIISGELAAGETLPTEPELAEQFGVSRAVVRDATRILMALGLVEVKHGSGVYVTHPQNNAFGEALLLALQRVGASAWDIEHFEQIIFPEVIALAATAATKEDLAQIQAQLNIYAQAVAEHNNQWWNKPNVPESALEKYREASQLLLSEIFNATHNKVLQQLALPLIQLRNLRVWVDDPQDTPDSVTQLEVSYFTELVAVIAAKNPEQARTLAQKILQLPSPAIEAMRQTPIGQRPKIPISRTDFLTKNPAN